jgi:hypothetical protein
MSPLLLRFEFSEVSYFVLILTMHPSHDSTPTCTPKWWVRFFYLVKKWVERRVPPPTPHTHIPPPHSLSLSPSGCVFVRILCARCVC